MRPAQPANCLSLLRRLNGGAMPGDAAAVRQAVDRVLACDPLVHCGHRLACTWLASQAIESLLPRVTTQR